jgi:hypothetical protein
MTGDHHGQTAGMATLLARALDGLLGTHNANHNAPVSADTRSVLR